MSIKDQVDVTQFEFVNMWHEPDGEGGIVTRYQVRLLNAAGNRIGTDSGVVNWPANVQSVIETKITEKKAAYATATGWKEHVPEVIEEEPK